MPVRLDKLLVERGLVLSRERAQGMILAGRVLVNEQKVTKSGAAVADDAAIRLLGNDLPFVSRGGLKLQGAIDRWGIALHGRWCADVGASTGGFTDCMLQRGAAGVVAVDTGYGQMAVPLRDDQAACGCWNAATRATWSRGAADRGAGTRERWRRGGAYLFLHGCVVHLGDAGAAAGGGGTGRGG